MNIQQARGFLYRNARPLDIARWKYLFEGGPREEVLTALAAYQNGDGGFGSALEPDSWNPDSTPVQTWVATEIVREVGLEDREHPIIRGILRYLSSGAAFDGHTWANCVPSNNDHPHAPWWDYSPGQEPSYNPTASLIGFLLKFAERDGALSALARSLAREAYGFFKAQFPMDSMHTAACFVRLYEYLVESRTEDIVDLAEFEALLHRQIGHVLTADVSTWAVDYVCKPSLFLCARQSVFYRENRALCDAECDFISGTQRPDGAWDITWPWPDYPEEWSISKNWWKSDVIIRNVQFFTAMRG